MVFFFRKMGKKFLYKTQKVYKNNGILDFGDSSIYKVSALIVLI